MNRDKMFNEDMSITFKRPEEIKFYKNIFVIYENTIYNLYIRTTKNRSERFIYHKYNFKKLLKKDLYIKYNIYHKSEIVQKYPHMFI